jgi:hypothetical protein
MIDKVNCGGFKNNEGDWGHLPNEPCRFCHQIGGVYFRVDDSPRGKNEPQVVRCENCGRDWESHTTEARAVKYLLILLAGTTVIAFAGAAVGLLLVTGGMDRFAAGVLVGLLNGQLLSGFIAYLDRK